MYELIVTDFDGLTDTSYHSSKNEVRRYLHNNSANGWMAKVYDGRTLIHDGKAVDFKRQS
jgi:hypothetical protein